MDPAEPQVRRFLARSMIARVLVKAPDGRPFITPYWFVTDDDRICISTGRDALVVRYIEADPRVVLLCAADRDGTTAPILRLSGTACIHHGIPGPRLAARYARKYIISLGGLRCELTHLHLLGLRRRYYAQATPVWIEVTPEAAAFIGEGGYG